VRNRFQEQSLEASSPGLRVHRVFGMLRESDQPRPTLARIADEMLGHWNAATIGKFKVEKNDVGLELFRNRHGTFGRSDGTNFIESACGKHETQRHADLPILVDDEDAR